jgi:NAD+ diphosphatase
MHTQWEITKYCNKCGFVLEEKAALKQCPNCHKKYYFNAKACAAVWLTNSKNEILLTKRAYDPFKGWWDIPGGFAEPNETLEDAAIRELHEETGLEMTNMQYVGSLYENYEYESEVVPIVAAIFKAKIKGNETVTVNDDVSDYQFVAIDKIDFEKIAFENQRKFVQNLSLE